jgi:hypothetical protein
MQSEIAGIWRFPFCILSFVCSIWSFAHIAQSVEHFLGKEEVTGSNPVVGSS